MKNKLDKYKTIIPDLDKKYIYKSPAFFTIFYNTRKLKNSMKDEDEIFKDTEEEFQKLKYLFKENWINILDQSAIKTLKFMVKKLFWIASNMGFWKLIARN